MKSWWRGILVAAAVRGAVAAAQPLTLGASMGLMFPSDRLAARSDFLGAAVLPGPCVALHVIRVGLAGRSDLSFEALVGLGLFESRVNTLLRTQYVPLELGASWEAANIEELALRLRFGGGPALLSTNMGTTRALLLAQTYVGGQVQRALHHLTVALDVSVGVLWHARLQNMVRAQLIVMTK